MQCVVGTSLQQHTIRVSCTFSAPWATIGENLPPIDKSLQHDGKHTSHSALTPTLEDLMAAIVEVSLA